MTVLAQMQMQNLAKYCTYNIHMPDMGLFFLYEILSTFRTLVHILLIREMVVECCYRRFGCKTIHPTKVYRMRAIITRS